MTYVGNVAVMGAAAKSSTTVEATPTAHTIALLMRKKQSIKQKLKAFFRVHEEQPTLLPHWAAAHLAY